MPADQKPKGYGCLSVLVVVVICCLIAALLHSRGSVERTEKKEEKQTVKTGVATKATSATVKSKKIDTTGFTFDSGHAAKSKAKTHSRTRNLTRKRVTTTFDPKTGSPTSRIEEDLTLSDASNTLQQSLAVATQQSTQAVKSRTTSITAAQTQQQTQATQEAAANATSETTVKPVQPAHLKLGLAQTTAGKTGLTYDVARKGPFTAAGIVTIDLKRGEVAGVGAGINTDVWFRGKYFVGVYGVHDVRDGANSIAGAIGYRF